MVFMRFSTRETKNEEEEEKSSFWLQSVDTHRIPSHSHNPQHTNGTSVSLFCVIFIVVAVICYFVTHFWAAFKMFLSLRLFSRSAHMFAVFRSFILKTNGISKQKQILIGKSRFVYSFCNEKTKLIFRCNIRSLQEIKFRDIGLCR